MIYLIFILLTLFSETMCPVDGRIAILEVMTLIKVETLHQRIKVLIRIEITYYW